MIQVSLNRGKHIPIHFTCFGVGMRSPTVQFAQEVQSWSCVPPLFLVLMFVVERTCFVITGQF